MISATKVSLSIDDGRIAISTTPTDTEVADDLMEGVDNGATEINITNCTIDRGFMEAVNAATTKRSTLTSIVYDRCAFGVNLASVLHTYLPLGPLINLESVTYRSCTVGSIVGMEDLLMHEIALGVNNSSSIRELILDTMCHGNEFIRIPDTLGNGALRCLRLRNCEFDSLDTLVVALAKSNCTLTKLEISDSQRSATAIAMLLAFAGKYQSLHELDLTNSCAMEIPNTFRIPHRLSVLRVADVDAKDMFHILRAIRKSKSNGLRVVSVGKIHPNRDYMEKVASLLAILVGGDIDFTFSEPPDLVETYRYMGNVVRTNGRNGYMRRLYPLP